MDAERETRQRGLVSRALVFALLVLAAVFVARALAPQTIGEQVRRSVLDKLCRHYADLNVSIRRGHYDPSISGVVFDDVLITNPAADTSVVSSRDMLRVERMVVIADVQPDKLLDQQSPVITNRIILEGVTADVWLQDNGELSLAAMWPPPQFGPVCPSIELRRVKLRLLDRRSKLRPIEMDVSDMVLQSEQRSDGKILKRLAMQGSSECFDSMWLKAEMLEDAFKVQGSISGVHLNRDVFDRLPESITRSIGDARDLELLLDTNFVATRPLGDGPMEYKCRTTVHEGRFTHSKLPIPITQIRGVITMDPRGVHIEASQALVGDAVCRVKGQVAGHAWPTDVNLGVSATGLWLDERLAGALPLKVRAAWDRLRPVGRVDIDAQVSYSAGRWNSDATVLCNGVDVSFEGFPYPAKQMVGRIEVRGGVASGKSIVGRVGSSRIECSFEMPLEQRPDPRKSFSATVTGPVPIDTELLESLSPRGAANDSPLETFVRSLQPRGSIHLDSAEIWTDATGQPHRQISLRVADGHMRYEKFAYPLYNLSGRVNVADSLVQVVGFQATNANAGEIRCDGTYRMPPKSTSTAPVSQSQFTRQVTETSVYAITDRSLPEPQLSLAFHATNVPMDESLRTSLPTSTRQTWDALMPGGVLDELDVLLTQSSTGKPLELNITANQNKTEHLTNRSLSMRPVAIPYRLDIAGGKVHYDGSKVTIHSLEGRHDFSRISADGVCQKDPTGQWLLELDIHSGSRMNPDAELIAALPNQMSESLRRLQLRGPVSIRGKTRLLLPTVTRLEPAIDWKLTLQLEGNRIGDVGPVHSLRGEILIHGRRDENGLFAAGNVRIDSMNVESLQITGIRGPYAIDGDRLRLGTLATARLPKKAAAFPSLATSSIGLDTMDASTPPDTATESSSIRGNMFGGTIEMDGEVTLSSSDFDVSVSLAEAEVPVVLAELGQTGNDIKGKISGQGRFDGKLGAGDLLKGSGAGRLSGANVYQLPMVVQLLNQLRITPTEDAAFTDGEVEFAMFGEQITLSRLQLWGEWVALDGGGTMNRRREVDLSFNTRVSPHNTFNRMLGPLGSQRYTLGTVDVRGPMDSPVIERRALDSVGQTLGRLFPSGATAEATSPSEPQSWFK